MNVTSNDFISFQEMINRMLKDNPKMVDSFKEYIRDRMAEEREIISNKSSACPIEALKDYKSNKSNIDMGKLKNIADGQFYNQQALMSMACTMDAIFYTGNHEFESVAAPEITKRMITDFRRIGSESSASGYALSGGVEGVKDMFVVKVPQTDDIQDLMHELFVGLMGTNSLRYYVPNYAYVFGGFECAPPTINSETREVVNWCSTSDDTKRVPYVIYENISSGISMKDMTKDCSYEDFISAYVQIVSALAVGNKKINFTHYDLHNDNIMMRDVSSTHPGIFQIPYSVDGLRPYYVTCNSVATIIDYGRSLIKYDKKNYGMPDYRFVDASLYPDRSWPLYDSYKLLMFSYMTALDHKNYELLPCLEIIFRFFNKSETMESALKNQWDYRYSFPLASETQSYNNVDLLKYIFKNCDLFNIVNYEPVDDLKVMSCNTCTSLLRIGKSIGAVRKGRYVPDTFLEFYDLQRYLYVNNKKDADRVYKKFDYKNGMIRHISRMENFIDKINYHIKTTKSINLSGFDISSYQTLVMIKSNYNSIFRMVTHLESLDIYEKVGREIAGLYDCEWPKSMSDSIKEINAKVCPLISRAIDNYNIILKYIKTHDWKAIVSKDKRLKWYSTVGDNILKARYQSCYVSYEEEKDIEGFTNTKSEDRHVANPITNYKIYEGLNSLPDDFSGRMTIEEFRSKSGNMFTTASPQSMLKMFTV